MSATAEKFRATGKPARSRVLLLATVFAAILIGGLAWFPSTANSQIAPPAVQIIFLGRVKATGLAVFSISNTSPFSVARSPTYRIQIPAGDGWTTQMPTLIPAGGMILSPGQQENISIVPPTGLKVWRIDLDVFRLGRPGRAGWLIDQVKEMLGGGGRAVYSCKSDLVNE